MKYFLHDTNSFNDEKISELFIEFGYEGLGLFYSILEKIAQQEKPVKTSVLKHQLKVGKKLERCWKFMESLGIISSNNGETFNVRLLSYSEKYQIKKENNRKRVLQFRENEEDTKNVTHYNQDCNAPKVKESKVNKSKVNRIQAFVKPTLAELADMFTEREQAEKMYNYYESNGWKVGKNPMKDWKAAARNWIKNQKVYDTNQRSNQQISKRDAEQQFWESFGTNIINGGK